ncbi:unnamed protein product [Caenorhabditis brenneri]
MDNNNTRFTSRLTHYDRSRFEVINWICKSFRCEIRELSLGYSVDEQFLKELIMERHKNGLRTKFDKVIVTTPVEQELLPFIDFQSARHNGSMENTSIVISSGSSMELKKRKLEIQRNKYHAMTPEQTKEYNAKRTELGRKRRQEEDKILKKETYRRSCWQIRRGEKRGGKRMRRGRSCDTTAWRTARRSTTRGEQLRKEIERRDLKIFLWTGPSDTYTASFFDDDDESLNGDEL